MMSRTSLLSFLALVSFALQLQAQVPTAVPLGRAPSGKTAGESLVPLQECTGYDAGSARPLTGAFDGRSNDVTLDRIYLCLGDSLPIRHNGDQRLDGDPDPGTPAGVGYAFYSAAPSVDGPTKASIGSDPALLLDGSPGSGQSFFIATDPAGAGNVTFRNDGKLQNRFNGDQPVELFFAPITFDRFNADGKPVYENGGACVSASIDAAFSVVYLNAIQRFDVQQDNCRGSFKLVGGLPEFDASERYSVTVTRADDPGVRGTVLNPGVADGGEVRYRVPEAGSYRVTVRDGKGCQVNAFDVDHTACTPPAEVDVLVDVKVAAPGATACVPIRVAGFTDVSAFNFTLNYDENRLTFSGIQNAGLSPFAAGAGYTDNGSELVVDVAAPGATTYTIPDDGVLFEACFSVGSAPEATLAALNLTSANGPIGFNDPNGAMEYSARPGGIILSSTPVVLQLAQARTGCQGADDKQIVITARGGVAPYAISYRIQGSGTAPQVGTIAQEGGRLIASDLSVGTYEVSVSDAATPANTSVQTLAVTEGEALTVTISRLNELRCFGDAFGSMRAVPELDGLPVDNARGYQFSWSGPGITSYTQQSISELGAGNYTVTVTDPVGCVATDTETLTAPAAIVANPITADATCTGRTDGRIEITPTGGQTASGNYRFRVSQGPAAPTFFETDRLDLPAGPGAYTILVSDDNGCSVTKAPTLLPTAELTLTVDTGAIVCAGDANGSVRVDVVDPSAAGSPTYTFNWSTNTGAPTNFSTYSIAERLGGDTYTVFAKSDASGCEARNTVTLTEPEPLLLELVSKFDESCDPGDDGSATVLASGGRTGAAPYAYSWQEARSHVELATTTLLRDLEQGDYQAYVTDAGGCVDSLPRPVSILEPVKPKILQFDNDTVRCHGENDGVLRVLVQETVSPIERIEWSTGETGEEIGDLYAGTYTVSVWDEAGCVIYADADVEQPDRLYVDRVDLIDPPCFEQGNGSIRLTMGGGTAPYAYSWSNGVEGVGVSLIDGETVTEGEYTVRITDANLCPTVRERYTLTQAPSINPNFENVGPATCAVDVCDGDARVTAALPNDPSATFDFVWSSGETALGTTLADATSLCGGRQTVSIQDSKKQCPPQEFSVAIPAPAPLELAGVDVDSVRCAGEATGSVEVANVYGGTPGYRYLWSNGAKTPNVGGLTAGTVTLTVEDAAGCVLTAPFEVGEPRPLVFELDRGSTIDPSCDGGSNGAIGTRASGGNLALGFSLTWSDDQDRDIYVARDLPAGTYDVRLRDARGCIADLTHTLVTPPPVQFALDAYDEIRCNGDLTSIKIASATGGVGQRLDDYRVSIDGSPFTDVDREFTVEGGVDIIITVVDGRECAARETLVIDAPQRITLELPRGGVEVELGDSVRLRPDIFPGGAPILYEDILWSPDTMMSFRNGDLTSPYVSPIDHTTYTVTVTDTDGCSRTESVRVTVDRNRNVYIPTGFSPNGDGANDDFAIYTGVGVDAITHFAIYDRWGRQVYAPETVDLNSLGEGTGWNGKFKGRELPAGVYAYVAEIQFRDGRTQIYRGDVTLLR